MRLWLRCDLDVAALGPDIPLARHALIAPRIAGMISKQDVADLEERLRASEACAADQAAELHEQSALIQTLECRTPRPDWPALLTGACRTALSEDEYSAAVATEGVSSCALAARLADKLGAYASGLQVRPAQSSWLHALAFPNLREVCWF